MRRSALIVDDSRVATATLKRMLEPHHMAVESAESGDEAIEYLRSNVPPAVVFLDHMMPGMDGFQVLGLLQKDPRLATIPIVMYTSQEGEAYMGQALARGAFGVLRKPPSPVALLRILEQLRLADEPVAKVPVVADPVLASSAAGARAPGARAVPAAPAPVERSVSPSAVPRTAAPSPASPPVAPPEQPLPDAATGTDSSRPIWVALYTLLLLVVSLWLLQQYRAADQARIVLLDENRALQARASAAAVTPAPAPEAPTAEPRAPRLLQALAWATNLHNQYGYDQLPLDDQRLALVRELVARLTQAGFEGVVRLETHVGEFCLTRDGFGGFKLPEPTAAIADCEIIDYSAEQATTLGRRQSPAFSRFLVQSNARVPVRVEVVSYGNERPLVRYPNVSTLRTAGEWNNIAARNQRVQIAIVPSEE